MEIGRGKCQSLQDHDVGFRGLCGKMPWSTMDVSGYRQRYIGHLALVVHQM